MTLPMWGIFAIVVAVAVLARAVKVWIVVAVLCLGLYIATTPFGQSAKNTIDHLTHPSATSTSTRSPR